MSEADGFDRGGNETGFADYAFDDDRCFGFSSQQLALRGMWIYGGYPIIVLGTVGHLLVITILLGSRGIRTQPLSVFLLVMSSAGLVALYVGLLSSVVEQHTCHHVMFRSMTSDFGCRLHVATIYFSLQLYSWMEACVAFERLVAVRWPLRYVNWFARRNNVIIACVTAFVLFWLNAIPFASQGYGPTGFCETTDAYLFQNVWKYVHCVVYAALPVAIMLPCNALTLRTMSSPQYRNDVNVKKARPVTIMMFCLNAIFVVTTVPIMVGDWNNLDSNHYAVVEIIWCICRLLMYLGSAITFAVYVAVGARFRKALKELLYSGKSNLQRALSVLSGGAYRVPLQRLRSKVGQETRTEATLEDRL